MNWLIKTLLKEARHRRFRPNDSVRYFTKGLKGRGKGIVLTPSFQRGKVVDFDQTNKKYLVDNGKEIINVHPRNIMPETVSPPSTESAPVAGVTT